MTVQGMRDTFKKEESVPVVSQILKCNDGYRIVSANKAGQTLTGGEDRALRSMPREKSASKATEQGYFEARITSTMKGKGSSVRLFSTEGSLSFAAN